MCTLTVVGDIPALRIARLILIAMISVAAMAGIAIRRGCHDAVTVDEVTILRPDGCFQKGLALIFSNALDARYLSL